jgi:hypothetical protein
VAASTHGYIDCLPHIGTQTNSGQKIFEMKITAVQKRFLDHPPKLVRVRVMGLLNRSIAINVVVS